MSPGFPGQGIEIGIVEGFNQGHQEMWLPT